MSEIDLSTVGEEKHLHIKEYLSGVILITSLYFACLVFLSVQANEKRLEKGRPFEISVLQINIIFQAVINDAVPELWHLLPALPRFYSAKFRLTSSQLSGNLCLSVCPPVYASHPSHCCLCD